MGDTPIVIGDDGLLGSGAKSPVGQEPVVEETQKSGETADGKQAGDDTGK